MSKQLTYCLPKESTGAEEGSRPPRSFSSASGFLALLTLLAAALPLLATISPVNHDETQYISAAYFGGLGLVPYRDFLYLQTPYQIYLFAPLFSIFEQHAFLAARILTGSIGSITLILVYLALRRFHVQMTRAAICCALLWLCHSFVFGMTIVRNDALPALLLAGAILVVANQLVSEGTSGLRVSRWLIGGVLLGVAIGTKISYAAPALGVLVFPTWAFLMKATRLRDALARSALFATGLIVALLPLLWFREAAALAFDYGNFGYHAEAPLAWYAANGLEDRLTLAAKVRDVMLTLSRGPALFAFLIYVCLRIRSIQRHESQTQPLLLMDLLVLAGLAATVAPTPTWRQYAIPLLPPLFIGLGLVWERAYDRGAKLPGSVVVAMLLAAIVGIGQPAFQVWKGSIGGAATPLVVAREGQFLATQAARAGFSGMSVSLSPEVVLASGLALDPTFATGPFAYRTAETIPSALRAAMHIASPESVIGYLKRTNPDVIVTGYENFDHVDEQGLEIPIETFASSQGYTRIESPYGEAVFWLRPPQAGPIQ